MHPVHAFSLSLSIRPLSVHFYCRKQFTSARGSPTRNRKGLVAATTNSHRSTIASSQAHALEHPQQRKQTVERRRAQEQELKARERRVSKAKAKPRSRKASTGKGGRDEGVVGIGEYVPPASGAHFPRTSKDGKENESRGLWD